MIRATLPALLIFSLVSSVWSQVDRSILKPDARAIGLGGSLVVQAKDPSVVFWNPSLLSALRDRQVLLNFNEPFSFNFASVTQFFPLYGTFGFALARFSEDSLEIDRGTFAWGRSLTGHLALGSSINLEKLDDKWWASANWGVFIGNPTVGTLDNRWRDVPISKPLDFLNLGFTVQNIPLGDKLFDPSALFGMSYLFPTYGFLINSGYHVNKGDDSFHLGLGVELNHKLTLFSGVEQFDFDKFGLGLEFYHHNFRLNLTYSTEFKKLFFTVNARIGPSTKQLAMPHYHRAKRDVKARNYKSAHKKFKKYLSYGLINSTSDSAKIIVDALDDKIAKTQFIVDSLLVVSRKLLAMEEPRYLRTALILTRLQKLDPDNLEIKAKLVRIRPVINNFLKDSIEEGIRVYETEEYEEAKDVFKRVILFDPKNDTALYHLAQINQKLSDLGEEYFYRGVGYYRQKKYFLAKEEFSKALEYNPNLQEALSYLKRTNARIEEKSQLVDGIFIEAERLEERQKYISAARKYFQILDIEPENVFAQQKLEELKPHIERFTRLKYSQGVSYLRNGEYQKAEESLRQVLSIDRDHKDAKRGLSNARKQKNEKVIQLLAQAEDLFERQNWNDAIETYSTILRIDPKNDRAIQGMNNIQEKMQISNLIVQGRKKVAEADYEEAVRIFKNILKIEPDNQTVKLDLMSASAKLNDLIEKYFNDGINAYTLDRHKDAIKFWDKVLALSPNHKGAIEYKQQALERIEALRSLK